MEQEKNLKHLTFRNGGSNKLGKLITWNDNKLRGACDGKMVYKSNMGGGIEY